MTNLLNFKIPESDAMEASIRHEPEIRVLVGTPDEETLRRSRMTSSEFEKYLDVLGETLAEMYPWATIKLYHRMPGPDVLVTSGVYEDNLDCARIVSSVRAVRKSLAGYEI